MGSFFHGFAKKKVGAEVDKPEPFNNDAWLRRFAETNTEGEDGLLQELAKAQLSLDQIVSLLETLRDLDKKAVQILEAKTPIGDISQATWLESFVGGLSHRHSSKYRQMIRARKGRV